MSPSIASFAPSAAPPCPLCPRCGAERADAEGEVCPGCLLRAALEENLERIDDYELIQKLDEGGMGRVHLARRVGTRELVAIKFPKAELLQIPEGADAFRRELLALSRLHHEHIAPIRNSGVHEGEPYVVLTLLQGGSLEEPANRNRYRTPEAIARLMLKIAKAMRHAHRAAILHCDLNPANILFDKRQEPHVNDLGLARVLDEPWFTQRSFLTGGRRGWVAPEQIATGDLTTATDVFALGVMLHWLLYDALPFADGEPGYSAHGPLPAWAPDLRWTLHAISHRALQRNPDGRYPSAAELAHDLQCAVNELPTVDERSHRRRRIVRWVRQHVYLAAIGLQLFALLLFVALMPAAVAAELRAMFQDQNAFTAVAQAGAVQHELLTLAWRVEAMAEDPNTARRLATRRHGAPPPSVLRNMKAFYDVFLFSSDREFQERWPQRPLLTPEHKDFAFRDYFRCAMRVKDEVLARGAGARGTGPDVCVSRVFRSGTDGEWRIGIAAPVFGPEGRFLGIIVGNIKTSDRFGNVALTCGKSGNCFTALLGPLDRESAREPPPSSFSVVAAHGLRKGEEKALEPRMLTRLCGAFHCPEVRSQQFEARASVKTHIEPRLADPVSGAVSIAAFAPAGATGLVVMVATPHAAVDTRTWLVDARFWLGLVVATLAAALLLGALYVGRIPRR